jgi:4-hydroxybenzoate polyprenyltransferase
LQGEIPAVAWVLFAATVLWALVYDTMYAMVDREDDLKVGIKSSAILFGRFDRLVIAGLQAAVLTLLAVAGVMSGRGPGFLAGLVVAAGLFAYQQALIRERRPAACFKAFLNNHYFGMAVFAGLVLDYLGS